MDRVPLYDVVASLDIDGSVHRYRTGSTDEGVVPHLMTVTINANFGTSDELAVVDAAVAAFTQMESAVVETAPSDDDPHIHVVLYMLTDPVLKLIKDAIADEGVAHE